MADPRPISVMAIARDAAAADGWKEAIAGAGDLAIVPSAESPGTAAPDVIITDRTDFRRELERAVPTEAAAEVGVIVIGREADGNDTGDGDDDDFDVHLPADVSPRELLLACRLVGKMARLRRQQRQSDRARQRLTDLAHTDPLTGLPNRRAWDERLAQQFAAATAEQPLCLAIVDLDGLKRVNDERGYAAGDELLRRVGSILPAQLRQGDFVARLGGDEFGLLLAGVDENIAPRVVERVRRAVAAGLMAAGWGPITASSGWRLYDESSETTPESLLADADAALRSAKAAGRNRSMGQMG